MRRILEILFNWERIRILTYMTHHKFVWVLYCCEISTVSKKSLSMWNFQVEISWKPLVISKGVFLIMIIWGIGREKKNLEISWIFKKLRKRVHNLALSFCLTEIYETCSRHSSRIKKFQREKKKNHARELKYTTKVY